MAVRLAVDEGEAREPVMLDEVFKQDQSEWFRILGFACRVGGRNGV